MNWLALWLIRRQVETIHRSKLAINLIKAQLAQMIDAFRLESRKIEKELRDYADTIKELRES